MIDAPENSRELRALPQLGVGLGYRVELHQQILQHRERIDFLELITEQFIRRGPEVMRRAAELREHFTLIPHGVELSIGTAAGIDPAYLEHLANFVEFVDAPWCSDHLSFSAVPGTNIGQLTQLWFTQECLNVVRCNVERLKERIRTPFLLENITYYFGLPYGDMDESDFTRCVLEQTGCGMLLDVNNVHINSLNLGFDPYAFLDRLPLDRIVQIHLGGGRRVAEMIVDTHSTAVRDEVWSMLRYILARAPVKGIILEWDQDFPDFSVLLDELEHARSIAKEVACHVA